jgi:plastocyanin
MLRTKYIAALGAALLAAAVANVSMAGWGGAAHAANAGVDATAALAFSPASVTITAGDTVTWTVTGAAPHTVTSDDGAFSSPGSFLTTGQTYQFTFSTPGTYHYHCEIHGAPGSGMIGTVVVEAAATPTDTPPATATTVAATPTRTRTPTETRTAEATAPAATLTPAPTAADPTPAPPAPGGAVEVTPTAPSGGAVAGALLPRAGGGGTRDAGARWPSAALAIAGGTALVAAGLLRRRRRA